MHTHTHTRTHKHTIILHVSQSQPLWGGGGCVWVGGALRSQSLLYVIQLLHLHVCSDGHVSVVGLLL